MATTTKTITSSTAYALVTGAGANIVQNIGADVSIVFATTTPSGSTKGHILGNNQYLPINNAASSMYAKVRSTVGNGILIIST